MQKTREAIFTGYRFVVRFGVPGGAAVLTATAFASYGLGMLRDRLFAISFGAGGELDAYNASFIIPDLLLNIFVAGALSAAFIPIFSGLLAKEHTKEAHELARSVMNSALLVIAFFGILVFIFAPQLAPFIAPGFSESSQRVLVNLLRIMILSPLIFALSNALGGMLIGYRRMFFYGLSPVFYNLGIILGTLFLVPFFGIYGIAIGTLGGALLHLGIRFFGMRGTGFNYLPKIILTADFKNVLKLMLPKMLGHPVEIITFWGFTIIASMLEPGSITVLNFARNFQSVPVSLFGIAFATASFPVLAALAAQGDYRAYRHQFFKTLRGILALTLASAAFIFFFRVFIIQFFLGGGAFDQSDILATAAVLGVFTLAIPTESTNHLLSRSFYALKNTIIPVVASILALMIAIGLGYILVQYMGVAGLALAFFIGSFFKLIVLSAILQRRVKLL